MCPKLLCGILYTIVNVYADEILKNSFLWCSVKLFGKTWNWNFFFVLIDSLDQALYAHMNNKRKMKKKKTIATHGNH
jgi:hypothetical protein